MGKATGFLEYERQEAGRIDPLERLKSFREFHRYPDEAGARRQAARCMDCGVPFCQSAMVLNGMVTGCPLHNLIPEWNDGIYRGNEEHALTRLLKTNPFPEFTGRVCPALCEKACLNGELGEAVTIHDNEHYLIEKAFEKGWMKPRIPRRGNARRVAVVGAGPAGLSAADALNQRGHLVTVYEREEEIGGLLMYGIPNMKLDKSVIKRRRELMEAEGIVFVTGADVGKDVPARKLLKEADALILACGAKKPRTLPGADPEKIPGICYAVDYLTAATKALSGKEGISAKGKDVVVLGGGDTGNDCIGTALRQGCRSVTALEVMPKPPQKRLESNPWPEWPKVLKTDYGHEEAIALFGKDPRIFETTVKEYLTDSKGCLKGIVTARAAFREGKQELLEGTEQELPCSLLLIAAGFAGCEDYTPKAFGLELSSRHTVQTEEESCQTGKAGIFAAGDMRRGQSLVVWAMAEGRRAAKEVDRYLLK
ncbi:MAG: glutamate synthase subunit beta [Lachnospiraceae bacterium]|nr:glutamate synthase subunit beta [Lachnospiraceae bacterium]